MKLNQKMSLFLLLIAVTFLSVWGLESSGQTLTAETLWKLKRVGAPSLSPDGSEAVVSVTAYDLKEDKGDADLWLISTRNGIARQLTTHAGKEENPVWSPDGRYIAFTARREGDESPQLYIIPVHGGEARKVVNVPAGVKGIKWFPDSRNIAFISRIWADTDDWKQQAEKFKNARESMVSAKVYDSARLKYWDH